MPTLQIRDLPENIHKEIAESAEMSRRSINQEAIVLLEKGLLAAKVKKNKKALIDKLGKLPKIKGLTSDDIVKEIRKDRER
jgi:plasmid stability protein